MTDPLSPTPLSEEERLHFTNLREAWRRAAPVYTDLAATDVEWLCTLIDRLSPGVAEPPAEPVCPGVHLIECPGCGAEWGPRIDGGPWPPPVPEGVVLLDGKQYSLVVDWLPAVWDEAIRDYLPRHPIPVRLDIEDQPVPVLPDPQEAEAFPPDPPEEN